MTDEPIEVVPTPPVEIMHVFTAQATKRTAFRLISYGPCSVRELKSFLKVLQVQIDILEEGESSQSADESEEPRT